MFFKSFKAIIFMPFILLLFISIFFVPIIYSDNSNIKFITTLENNPEDITQTLNSNYAWPVPGITQISSKFGPRKAPTAGASTFHAGIDIPATPGTNLVSISNGSILFTGWNGAAGYCVIIQHSDFQAHYFHVDPNFLVSSGEIIKKGQVIAKVGPLNVYGISNNPYKDSKGNPTNGATTGPHLHFTIKKEGQYIDPLTVLIL